MSDYYSGCSKVRGVVHIRHSYRAFDLATPPDAAGFIRPKIETSLPVGRGVHAERGSCEACAKEPKRTNPQTTGVAHLPFNGFKTQTE